MVRGIAGRRKRYVEVEADVLGGRHASCRAPWRGTTGGASPCAPCWGVRRCASLKVGGEGVRYDVVVGNAHTFLFHEEPALVRGGDRARAARPAARCRGVRTGVRTDGSPVQRATDARRCGESGLLRSKSIGLVILAGPEPSLQRSPSSAFARLPRSDVSPENGIETVGLPDGRVFTARSRFSPHRTWWRVRPLRPGSMRKESARGLGHERACRSSRQASARPSWWAALAQVWERSVRATHGFLSEDDIAGLRPEVAVGPRCRRAP